MAQKYSILSPAGNAKPRRAAAVGRIAALGGPFGREGVSSLQPATSFPVSLPTIAAIATASGEAGVAVVRISGPEALPVARRVAVALRRGAPPEPGTFRFSRFVDPRSGEVFDEGVVLVFQAPRSYTGEEVVELQGHGGRTPSRRLLDAVLAAGARPAGPGEFTRRAFLNGKMDLTQAEAVADLIASRTVRAARAARAQLDGVLGRRLDALYEDAADLCADLEAWLDLEEGEVDAPSFGSISGRIGLLGDALAREIASAREGRLLREGALVVIGGAPNVGKSSLLNALLGVSRAIVSDEPGTTRDVVEESLSLEGVPLRIADTAGLREAPGAVEREGVSRARDWISRADLRLHLLDASGAPFAEQLAGMDGVLPRDTTLLVLNKCDLAGKNGAPLWEPPEGWTSCRISALTGEGLDALRRAMADLLRVHGGGEDADVAVAARHRDELEVARAHAMRARSHLGGPDGAVDCVLAAHELRQSAEALGRITGRVFSEELLDRVFSRFCVGK